MKYIGKLVDKYKKKQYSVFKKLGMFYLNGSNCHILTEYEYSDFLQLEELMLRTVR